MKKSSKIVLSIVIIIMALFVGAGGMYILMTEYPANTASVSGTKKNVTINDTGISESVNKIYDAVVIVSGYVGEKQATSGSGFVYKTADNKAFILTNNHVINGCNKVKVTFSNNKTYDVEIVGGESYADIAVLKIDKKNITTVASIGKSEDSKLGDTVFTVGAPLDNSYSGTVTRGIISGKDRMVAVSLSSNSSSSGDYIMKVIQTDAAINSGNSGGPLANVNGEVIGITNMKLVSSGVEGMGFAIPIEDAINYATQIEKNGKIARPALGITMSNVSDTIFNFSEENIDGVKVAEVAKNSSAEQAGIQAGDIIIEIDNDKVTSSATLRYYLYKHNVGDKIKVKVKRGNDTKTFNVKLQASE